MGVLFKANDATTTDNSSETTTVPNYSTNDGLFINTTHGCAQFENESSCSTTSETVDDEITEKIGIITEYIGYVAIPVFLVIGLSGNTLTIIVMLSPQFRKMSISVILVALAFSDTTLILMLPFNKRFVREILGVDIRALSTAGCKIFFFMFRSAKMTSSWFVVLLCLEKFVAVWFPLKTKFICTKRNAYIGLALVYTLQFSYNGAWTFASRLANGVCIPHYPKPAYLAEIFVAIGICLYSIIPICLLMIFTPLTCYKLFQRVKLQRTLSSVNHRVSGEVRKTTTMLLSVSIAYMLLVAPITVAHIVFYLQGLNIFETTQPGMVIYREISQVLEQLNYSINFFLYVICSKSFRDRVILVLTCKKQPIARYLNQFKTRESTTRDTNEASAEKSCSRMSSINSLSGGAVNNSDFTQVYDDCQK